MSRTPLSSFPLNEPLRHMMSRNIAWIAADATLAAAAQLMAERSISSLLVGTDGRVEGILTEHDLLQSMYRHESPQRQVRELMSAPVLSIREDAGFDQALTQMLQHRMHHLLVVDSAARPVGVISESDLIIHGQFSELRAQLSVNEVMLSAVLTLPADASLRQVMAAMEQSNSQTVVAVQGLQPVGILTERDMVRHFADGALFERALREVMTPVVISIPYLARVADAVMLMAQHRIRHLVVVREQGEFAGVITQDELLKPFRLLTELSSRDQRLAESLLQASRVEREKAILRTLIDSSPDLIWLKDLEGVYLACNSEFSRLYGAPEERIVGCTDYDFVDRELADFFRRNDQIALQRGEPSRNEELLHFAEDGYSGVFETVKTPVRSEQGEVLGVLGVARDISERLQTEQQLRLSGRMFEAAHEGILIIDAQQRVVDANPMFCDMTGYGRDELIGCQAADADAPLVLQRLEYPDEQLRFWRGEVDCRSRNGERLMVMVSVSALIDGQQGLTHYICLFSDITALKVQQRELERMAHYDALTGLPNRVLFADRLGQTLARADRSRQRVAVCYLDLDGFKPVNDSLGHSTGDKLLVEVAQRLQKALRGQDTVARIGGDEFVVLLTDLESVGEAIQVVERLLQAVALPLQLLEGEVAVSASAGITLFPEDGADPDLLLRHADQAMYQAKLAGRNRVALYDTAYDARVRQQSREVDTLASALAEGQFELFLQPQVNIRQSRVLGFEVLVRWRHPERGLLAPGEFLPQILGTELCAELDHWILQRSMQILRGWREQPQQWRLSVNLFGYTLLRPDFIECLRQLLAAFPEVSPGLLEIEVLETAALEDIVLAGEVFRVCRELGLRVALDDFGTGYSSLTYFRRLPANTLKIDQSFVRDMLNDAEDRAIVESVIGLAHAFDREVVAEGVETAELGRALQTLGCDVLQGYGIARPMPADQAAGWAESWQPKPQWHTAVVTLSADLRKLIQAERAHQSWFERIRQTLFSAGECAVEPACQDYLTCQFGRWFYGPGRSDFGADPGFDEIESVHRQLHHEADRLLQLARDGRHREGQEGFAQLNALSERMLALLQQLRETRSRQPEARATPVAGFADETDEADGAGALA